MDKGIVKGFYKNNFRPSQADLESNENNNSELRSVVAVFRHGDRTPKQKMKMKTNNPDILKFFDEADDPKNEIKLKLPA